MTQTLEQQYVDACIRGDLGRRARLAAELDQQTQDHTDRLAAPDALTKAATWYARRGIAVFPCAVRGKKPITRHGLKDASTDAEQIRTWWRATPAANIGAPTGVLFDVIDIDGPEGIGSTYAAGVKFPPEIGHSLTSRPSGHHVFIKPTGQGNRAGIYPAVDYRGAGGYVILPPSVGANGRRYVWTTPLNLEAA